MMPRVRIGLLAACWLVCVQSAAADDEQLLRSAGIDVDARSLLDFFRSQTADEATARRIAARIDELGSDSFPVREKAGRQLAALGPVALSQLRKAADSSPDLEVRRRAREAVGHIRGRYPPAVAAAAARLLARHRPEGLVEALLAFLPGPYDEDVIEEVHAALAAAARRGDGVHPELLRSLSSASAARRAAAAVALCRGAGAEVWPEVRKRLHDADSGVRFTAARELAAAGDREAVPVLVELLAQLSDEQAGQVEEILYRLAGAGAPPVVLGADAAARRRCRDAWRDWWRAHGDGADLAALRDRERELGYTLLVLLNDNRVVEWDRDGRPRWQVDGLAAPLDAEALPNRRVLVAEHDTRRVTERNLKGEVLWEKKLAEPPIHAQRLPDGGTFIATRQRLLEVDRSGGREVVRYRSADGLITARRFRDGRIGCVEKGQYFELSPAGRELRRFAVPAGVWTTNALTLLGNGHLLVTSYGGGSVQEYDRAGAVVWRVQLGRPLCAARLPGGRTLVSTQDMVLVEFDRAGKEVGRRDAPGHPCQVRRR